MLKKVTVAETSIFCNIGPILTVFIGGLCIADERVTLSAVVKVSISFIGVTMVVLGKKETIKQTEGASFAYNDDKMEFHYWYYAVMAMVPFAIAMYNFTLGFLRGLNPKFIPFYMTFVSIFVYGIMTCFCTEMGNTLPSEEELESNGIHVFWLLALGLNGLCYLIAMQTKVLGFRYDLVTRVAPIEYLETPYSLIIDALLFNVSFSKMSLSGLGLVIMMFLIIIFQSLRKEPDD